ncbi:hypothetical protein JCM1840_000382 [Sporobolomyces johnsonii]
MATPQATKRLRKEHQMFQKNPPSFIWATPNESNILEWHYIMRGPPGTPYEGGEYWGVVTFPKTFPFAPPELKMNTPSGRFAPSTAICTSMSNFHPAVHRQLTEDYCISVAWSTETILVGLLSFMLSDEITTGAIRSTDAERRALAAASHAWNIAQPKFRTIFPEYAGPAIKDVPNMTGGAPPPAPPQGEGVAPAGVGAGAGAAGRP